MQGFSVQLLPSTIPDEVAAELGVRLTDFSWPRSLFNGNMKRETDKNLSRSVIFGLMSGRVAHTLCSFQVGTMMH